MGDHVLVVGGGGREHSLAWKLAQSPQIKQVYVSPGNAGTEKAEKICNISLDLKDFDAVASWCKENTIEMVVIGPEDPLANGIVDHLSKAGIKCFGPSAKAAQIEASKQFAKSFMDRHKIPTARWKSFTEAEAACDHINSVDYKALVVKASGLAAGKGVIVAKVKEEACTAVKQMLEDKAFGTAGSVVVIEELLEGEEVSCLAFSDGTSIACLPAAQDHKRLLDGDQGLNTGGMGAYCPCPLVSEKDLEVIKRDVLQKAVDGLKAEGTPYIGVLYAGLMLTKGGPRTLEFNCRFGDPETQVLMPMLQSDLYLIIKKCVAGDLAAHSPQYHSNKSAVAVVTVSNGYPGSYKKGFEITGLDKAEKELGLQVFHAGTTHKDGKVVTSGGRVLAVVAIETDLAAAARQAQLGATAVQYDGKFFRKDIGQKAMERKVTMTYKDSGVDIGAGDHLVRTIKPLAAATKRSGCTAELGMFGGVFDIKAAGYKDPLLVSGTDGVGTKLKVAQACGLHKTVGVDLVAMCVNDVLAHGAEPLFFLDYFACGKLDVGVASNVVSGVAEGCQLAGCALLGGETAEMPGMYPMGEYDLAGFAVGAVERDQYLPRMSDITEGDAVIGLSSSGIHSNGYSLVRRIVEHCKLEYKSPSPFSEDQSLGEALLTPTKIYSRSLLPVLWLGKIKALAHITGGGLPGNVARVLPEDLAAELDALSWNVQPVFGWLAAKGNIPQDEMACTFNCGIGAVLVTSKEDVDTVIASLKAAGESASHIGSVCKAAEGKSRIEIKNLSKALQKAFHGSGKHKAQEEVNCAEVKRAKVKEPVEKKKVGVLISGTGTNLQALIDWTQNPNNDSSAEIVLVISNKPGVLGLQRAEKAGIATKVIPNKDFKSREDFDMAMHQVLINADVEVVCLAGFMRILSATFVSKWQGKMLNIHPSLLPSFKGHNAHKQVLEAGVRISGCTVHFVTEEVDAGTIIAQESVAVYPGDTEDSLAERVKTVEHKTYPLALELVTSGKVTVAEDGKITWQ